MSLGRPISYLLLASTCSLGCDQPKSTSEEAIRRPEPPPIPPEIHYVVEGEWGNVGAGMQYWERIDLLVYEDDSCTFGHQAGIVEGDRRQPGLFGISGKTRLTVSESEQRDRLIANLPPTNQIRLFSKDPTPKSREGPDKTYHVRVSVTGRGRSIDIEAPCRLASIPFGVVRQTDVESEDAPHQLLRFLDGVAVRTGLIQAIPGLILADNPLSGLIEWRSLNSKRPGSDDPRGSACADLVFERRETAPNPGAGAAVNRFTVAVWSDGRSTRVHTVDPFKNDPGFERREERRWMNTEQDELSVLIRNANLPELSGESLSFGTSGDEDGWGGTLTWSGTQRPEVVRFGTDGSYDPRAERLAPLVRYLTAYAQTGRGEVIPKENR